MTIKNISVYAICGFMLMTTSVFAESHAEKSVETTQQNDAPKVVEQASDMMNKTVDQAEKMTKSAVDGLDDASKQLQKHTLESLDYAQTKTTQMLNSARVMVTTGEVDENMSYAFSVVGGAVVGTTVASMAGVSTIPSIAIIATGGFLGSMLYATDDALIDADKPAVKTN